MVILSISSQVTDASSDSADSNGKNVPCIDMIETGLVLGAISSTVLTIHFPHTQLIYLPSIRYNFFSFLLNVAITIDIKDRS